MTREKILVCVAWPYANGCLHMGHMAGSIMPADIFARYHRMRGNEVLMVSGSDMHGAPIAVRADKENTTPEEIAFKFHEINKKAIEDIGASFDLFTNTHTEHQVRTVQDIFMKLLENGYLEKRISLQFYCESCNRFLPDRYVEGFCPNCGEQKARGDQCDSCGKALNAEELVDPQCQLCSSKPALRETEHFFLLLSAFTDRLRDYLKDKKHWRPKVWAFTMNILDEGLQDRAITRDLSWGIPVPVDGFETKRIYVWFEAVIGYLSASEKWAQLVGDEGKWEYFWKDPEARSYYFIGKDNTIFHTIIWPSILLGYGGINLPYDVPANEFMNFEGEKFSKSAGVSIDLPDMLEKFQPDAIRYYLSVNMPELRDTDFSWDDFVAKINNELVATYGNFIHRVLSFTQKHFGEIPSPGHARDEWKKEVSMHIEKETKGYMESVENCNFKQGLRNFMDLAKYGNQFFDSIEPWALIRQDKEDCGSALNLALEVVRALAVMAHPYMPFSSQIIWKYLGFDGNIGEAGWNSLSEELPAGNKLTKPEPLFKKVDAQIGKGDISGFSRLNLKIGKITGVEQHPNADKLYVLSVNIGRKIRLVAGIKDEYSPDELIGKNIVILSNLEPARIRGVKSEGMLLAAETKSDLALLTPAKDMDPGTPVDSGREQSSETISFQEFQKLQLAVGVGDEGKATIQVSMKCVNCDSAMKGKKIALFINGEKALALRCPDGTYITVDRDIQSGAKVR